MTPRIRRAAPGISCLAALLAAGLAPAAADTPGRGVLWTVEGRHNTVYLLGSVHLLRESDGALPDTAEAAYEDAERLVMEIDLDDPAVADPAALLGDMQRSARLPEGTTLRTVLGPDYPSIAGHVEAAGLDLGLLDGFTPWFVATLLVQVELAKLGFRPELGIEQRIALRAARDRKPIEGLETPAGQFAVLARLPLPVQKRFLQMAIEETTDIDAELDRLLEAWRAGDSAALADLLTDAYDRFPELYGPLTEERNRAWLTRLETLLGDRDDYLVVVGALHLVGPHSVVDLLRQRGYRVTQQ